MHSWAVPMVLLLCVVLSSLPFCWGSLPITDGHDLIFHLERIESIAGGLAQGHVPVWLYPNQAYGYGYPTGVCYPSIFLYPFALLRLAGLPLMDAYRVFVVVVNSATTLLAYACFRRMASTRATGLVCTMLWVLAPYRLVDLWLRAAVGEYLALIFVPLIGFGLWRICLEPKASGGTNGNGRGEHQQLSRSSRYVPTWLALALGMSGVVQSHVLSIVLLLLPGLPLLLVLLKLGCSTRPLREMLTQLLKAVVACVLLCANVIVPLFSYSLGETLFTTVVAGWGIPAERALDPWQVVGAFTPFRGTSTVIGDTTSDDMPTPIGIALALVFIVGVIVLAHRGTRRSLTRERRVLLAALLAVALLLAFATTYFFPWWLYQEQTILGAAIRVIGIIQFPWRLIGPLCYVLVLVAAIVFDTVPQNVTTKLEAEALLGNSNAAASAALGISSSESQRAEDAPRASLSRALSIAMAACCALCVIEAIYDNVSLAKNTGYVSQEEIAAIEAHKTWSIGFGEYLDVHFDANVRDSYEGLLTGDEHASVIAWRHDDVTAAELEVDNAGTSPVTITVPVLYNRFWRVVAVDAGGSSSLEQASESERMAEELTNTPTLSERDGYLAVVVPAGFAGVVHLAFVAPTIWYLAQGVSLITLVAIVAFVLVAARSKARRVA